MVSKRVIIETLTMSAGFSSDSTRMRYVVSFVDVDNAQVPNVVQDVIFETER